MSATTLQNPTLSVLIKPMTTEFGWSRSVFVAASSIGTIMGGLLALVVGPAIDRYGARWILFSGFLVMGGLMMAMGSVHSLWQFYLRLITSRMILQGVINLANNVVVAKWFYRKRGVALAIPAIGQRVGSGSIPIFAQAIIATAGWRASTLALGALAWALTLVPAGGWLRRRPEDLGLAPDGDLRTVEAAGTGAEPTSSEPEPAKDVEYSFTLREALRTRTFYVLLTVVSLSTFINAGTNFNIFPILTDRGLSDFEGVVLLSIWSYVGIPATLVWGFLGDRVAARYLLASVLFGMALGVGILTQVEGFWLGVVFALFHGVFFAGALLLQNLIFATYFGRSSFGAIRGFITPFQTLSNAMGPLAATVIFDTQGDYGLILVIWMVLLPALALTTLMATPVARPQHGATALGQAEQE